ncbi:response regulator [bacterium AH-315-J04]|nr:response regulator [bacterium AH-315-J04]
MPTSNDSQPQNHNGPCSAGTIQIKTPQVLVIEDNPDNMKLFAWLLEDLEYDFTGCVTGEDGLEWLASNKPDLLLLDISLPGIDGKEVARRLRAQKHFESLPIIAVTAHAIKSESDEIMNSGVTTLVTKPIDEKHLKKVIKSFLDSDHEP